MRSWIARAIVVYASRLLGVFVAMAAALPHGIAVDPVAVASIIGYNEDTWTAVPSSPKPRQRD